MNGQAEEPTIERPLLILEKQLMDTLELCWHVQQARIRPNGATPIKIHLLFDGIASELQIFIEMIRKRLESRSRQEPHVVEMMQSSYWRLFAPDRLDLHDQLESLLCGYAHYARQTSQAMASLQRQGDLKSFELMAIILKGAEQCLWFLEIYLEGLALNSDSSRLPDWRDRPSRRNEIVAP
jgi:starvation-inducible DNA-binding protein